MKKTSFWHKLRFVPCLLFLGIMVSLFLRNGDTFLRYTQEHLSKDYKAYTQGAETYLSENLAGKHSYIDFNGAVAKLLGINTLNDRFRLKNGYMAAFTDFGDIDASADNVKMLSDFLEQEDIGFLYVYIPPKEHCFDAQVPAGYGVHNQNATVTELAKALDARQVNHLNPDDWFRRNGWKMEDIYFRTDHHWLPEAAFTTVRLIMERLAETGDVVFDAESLAAENWVFEVYEDYFLGADGRQTGPIYAGVDDFCVIHPKEPSEIYVGRVNPDRTMPNLDTSSIYRLAGLDGDTVYDRDPYGVYLGNNYPYAYIRNDQAVNNQRLLVIGDSYRLPAECFLITQFSELIHVDMREYKDGSFAALVKQVKPDQVLFLGCVPAFEKVEDFGLEGWAESFSGKVAGAACFESRQLTFGEAADGNTYSPVVEVLAAGAYQLTLEQASFGNASSELIQFALMDKTSGEVSCARYFVTEYSESQQWLFTVPEDGNYKIVAYHGMPGSTLGKALILDGITLSPLA